MFMRGMIFPGGREPVLQGDGIYLRYPQMSDFAAWAALRRFAAKLCERGSPAMASVGPVGRLESLDRFARRFGRAPVLAGA